MFGQSSIHNPNELSNSSIVLRVIMLNSQRYHKLYLNLMMIGLDLQSILYCFSQVLYSKIISGLPKCISFLLHSPKFLQLITTHVCDVTKVQYKVCYFRIFQNSSFFPSNIKRRDFFIKNWGLTRAKLVISCILQLLWSCSHGEKVRVIIAKILLYCKSFVQSLFVYSLYEFDNSQVVQGYSTKDFTICFINNYEFFIVGFQNIDKFSLQILTSQQ